MPWIRKGVATVLVTMLIGCAPEHQNTRWGALGGAAVGTIIGNQIKGDKERNRIVGALVGGLVGAALGNYLDRKERELKDAFREKVVVERPRPNQLMATFSDSIPFDSGSARLKSSAYPTLQKLGQIFRDNPDARLVITGHTDNVGNHLANQRLSEQRAEAVAKVLVGNGGMEPSRVALRGAGEMAPVVSNDTARGRAQNRRVDILILPMSDPVPPVRFTMTADTEPAGYRPRRSSEYMTIANDRSPSPSVPLADNKGKRVVPIKEQPGKTRETVEEVVTEKPHLYSPIRTVEELLSIKSDQYKEFMA